MSQARMMGMVVARRKNRRDDLAGRRERPRRAIAWRMAGIEGLEDRTLLSTTYPLDRTTWTALGPAPITSRFYDQSLPSAGRTVGVAADPVDVNRIFIATAGGGVWRTTDGGVDWTPLTDDQPTLFMGSLALAPSDPNVLYAGTGEAHNSADSYYGRGILVSTDGGDHWTLTGQDVFDRLAINEIAVDPTDPNIAYAAVCNFAANGRAGNTGIFKTTDGGASWISTTDAISETSQYTSVKIDPADPQTLYAAIGYYGGSPLNGVYQSHDGGATWQTAGNFPQGTGNGRIQLAISPSSPTILYAAVSDPSNFDSKAIYKTTDGGATWTATTRPPEYMGNQGWYDSFITVSPTDPDVVFAGGSSNYGRAGIVESRDGGASWFIIRTGTNGVAPHTDFHYGGFDAEGRLLVVNDGGIWRLDNPNAGKIAWSNLNGDLQITQFTGIVIDPTDPDIAYGGSQDNGTEKFTDALGWTQVRGGDGGYVRIDPTQTSLIYHTYTGNTLERSNSGAYWASLSSGLVGTGNFYPSYQVDQNGRILFGTDRINVREKQGTSWSQISSPGNAGWPSGTKVNAIEVARTDPSVIYTATSGVVYITTNNGASWSYSNVAGNSVAALEIDPTNSQVAYAVRNRFGGGHVFQTTDGGGHWSDISGNLPDLPTNTIRVGKTTTGDILYVGTDDGVYSSSDGGAHWTRLGEGLPHAQVVELDLNPTLGILAVGTHGRGLFELSLTNAPLRVVDNRDFGFRATGAGWSLESGGHEGSYRVHAWGNGDETARWNFGQAPGPFEVFATWVPDPANSPRAVYEVYDGNTLIGQVTINQQLTPNGVLTDGTVFQSLGVFTSTTHSISIRLPVSNGGQVIADAVYLAIPYAIPSAGASPLDANVAPTTTMTSGRAFSSVLIETPPSIPQMSGTRNDLRSTGNDPLIAVAPDLMTSRPTAAEPLLVPGTLGIGRAFETGREPGTAVPQAGSIRAQPPLAALHLADNAEPGDVVMSPISVFDGLLEDFANGRSPKRRNLLPFG